MNRTTWSAAFVLCTICATWAYAQSPAETERIDALVRKLGSASFVQREQARKELEAIGPAALPALQKAAKASDAETARRIGELIARFEEHLLTKQILTPKEIELKLEKATVQEAIAELASKSGYAIQFQGDATLVSDRKITLTGKLAFWQAFEKLCEQGGLMEVAEPARPEPTRIMRSPHPVGALTAPAGPFKLTPRKGADNRAAVSHAGSVLIEARISREAQTSGAQAHELVITLLVKPEPSLLNASVAGPAKIAKLIDADGKDVRPIKTDFKPAENAYPHFAYPTAPTAAPRSAQIRLKDDAGKQLNELAGTIPLQVDVQNVRLAGMDKIMDAAGKSVQGANGGSLTVQSIKKVANNAIELQVTMENLTPNPLGNNVIINGNNVIIRGNVQIQGGIKIGPNGVHINGAGAKDLPDLLDAKGQKFTRTDILSDSINIANGSTTRTVKVLFQPNAGQAEPSELVLMGTRTHTIAVPFRFENLALPK